MSVVIYHNPRCSKSRETLALLEEKGITPNVVKYLEEIPSIDALKALFSQLGFTSVREMMRTKETEYKEQNALEQDGKDLYILNISTFEKDANLSY